MDTKKAGFNIRRRERIDSSPPPGLRQTWTEYQVVTGRKIVARYGTLDEARGDYPGAKFCERPMEN